jgi:hypothetical protein
MAVPDPATNNRGALVVLTPPTRTFFQNKVARPLFFPFRVASCAFLPVTPEIVFLHFCGPLLSCIWAVLSTDGQIPFCSVAVSVVFWYLLRGFTSSSSRCRQSWVCVTIHVFQVSLTPFLSDLNVSPPNCSIPRSLLSLAELSCYCV